MRQYDKTGQEIAFDAARSTLDIASAIREAMREEMITVIVSKEQKQAMIQRAARDNKPFQQWLLEKLTEA